jgi:hypothetical protein
MLAITPLRDLAIAWLEEQDPATGYDWTGSRHCACGRLARALGRYEEWSEALLGGLLKSGGWDGPVALEWRKLNLAARGGGHDRGEWTFGGFLARLKAAA